DFFLTDRVVRTHRPNPRERKGEIHAATREFCRYACPFSLWACVTLISLYADRWILQSIVGEREVGIYIALYQIANAPIALTVGILHQFVTPIIFDAAADMKTAEQRLQSSDLVNISVSGCAILMALVVIVAYHFSEQL